MGRSTIDIGPPGASPHISMSIKKDLFIELKGHHDKFSRIISDPDVDLL